MTLQMTDFDFSGPISTQAALSLVDVPQATLLSTASDLRDAGHGRLVSYSRKVFIPLTQLCRDVCHYCTFAKAPKRIEAPYLSPDQVLEIARAGQAAGCKEALFTLGDKPELRYSAAREALVELGYSTTLEYLAAMAFYRNWAIAASKPWHHDGARIGRPSRGVHFHGDHVGIRVTAPWSKGGVPLRVARQRPRGSFGNDARSRAVENTVHKWNFDRHRGNPN